VKKLQFIIVVILLSANQIIASSNDSPETKYKAIQTKLQTGWGTFNHKSVLSHVLLPEGFAMNIGIKLHQNNADNYLKEAFISSRGLRPEKITPGYKAYYGSYSDLTVEWNGVKFRIESATTENQDLMLLVTPIENPENIPSVVLETGMLWNRPGTLELDGNTVQIKTNNKNLTVRSTGAPEKEFLANTSPYLAVKLNQPVAFYTGETKNIEQIKALVAKQRAEIEKMFSKYGELAPTYQAIQSVIGWNMIYDASNERVIFPVSRLWNDNFGGQYVLFDWDTYFGAWMASLESKELAYANAVEITKAITPGGFIPNFSGSYGSASFDRSQPSEVIEFLKKVHVTWDETRVLAAIPGEMFVVARRNGEKWFVAGINGKKETQEINIELPFSLNNPVLFSDGETLNELAIQNLPGNITSVSVKLMPDGGFVMY